MDTTHQYVIDPLGERVTNVLRNDTRYYYIKDHLGSVRLTIDEDGNTVSAQDYSPFGRIIRSYNAGEDNDYYKFTEKERDKETGYDYFGARFYDSQLSQWLCIDPLADKYPGWSPYNYALNNPMKYYDPDGRGIKEFWAKFSQAVNYKLSLGLGVALKADCKGKGAGFSLNLINSSVVSGDLSQNPEMFSGEKSSGASLETPGLALGVETTVSPTTKSTSVEYINGIPRFTSTQSNSKTEKISLNIGGVDLSKSSTVTRTKDNYANEVNSTPEVTQYEVGGSMASFQFGAGVLLDLNLDVLLIFEALGEL